MLQSFFPVSWLSRSAQLVPFAREPDELGLDAQFLQSDEELIGVSDWGSHVVLAVNDENRRLHIVHIPDG